MNPKPLVILALLLAGCGGNSDDEPDSGPVYTPGCPPTIPACVVQPPAPPASHAA